MSYVLRFIYVYFPAYPQFLFYFDVYFLFALEVLKERLPVL